jgi:predicted nucleic acid-binding protein
MNTILIDTNVLLYAHDGNDPTRQAQALEVLQQLELTASGRLSVQCLAEFFNVATRKLTPPLTAIEAVAQIERLAHSYPVLDLTTAVVLEAGRGARDHQLAYYDAQLWALAKLNQIPVVFSEDFRSGSSLEGVRFVNPFAADFDLETWV